MPNPGRPGGPVAAGQVQRQRDKSMIKEVTKQSAFANRWENLYEDAQANAQDLENLAERVSKGLVYEFHKKKFVSDKSAAGRKESFQEKEELRRNAEGLHDWDQTRPKEDAEREVDEAYTQDPVAFARMIKRLADDNTDYMEFKDDKNFLLHFDESVTRLKEMQALYSVLEKITPEDYAQLNRKLEAGNLGSLPSLEEARQKSMDAVYMLDYYEAKKDVMRNPFYTVLKPSDTEALSLEDKKTLAENYERKNNPKLAEYFNALSRMEEAAGLGAKHEQDSRKAAFRFGNSGRKRHKWRLDFFSVKQSASHVSAEDLRNIKGDADAVKQEQKMWRGQADPPVKYADRVNLGLNASLVNYSAKLKAAKASIKKRGKIFSFGANASLLAMETENDFSVKGGLSYHKGKGLKSIHDQGGNITISAGGAVAKGRVKAGLNLGNVFKGEFKAKGKALSANASALAKAGYIKWYDKNGDEHNDFAAAAMLDAGAALVEGEVGVSFSLFGVKIGASLTGELGGFGGTIGGAVTNGTVEASFGALFGLGFKLNVKVDFSGVVKYFKDRKKAKKLKEKQREQYTAKNRGRAMPPKPAAQQQAGGGNPPPGAAQAVDPVGGGAVPPPGAVQAQANDPAGGGAVPPPGAP